LRVRAIALVNAGRVPTELLEPLMNGVGALDDLRPLCLPKVQASKPSPPPGAHAPERKPHRDHGHGEKRGDDE
jgi:hypothetical protein